MAGVTSAPSAGPQATRSRRSWRDLLRFLVRQRGSPEAIARGMALGMVIAFSPTIGIQVVLALFLATVINANRLAAVVPVFATNIFTVPVVYGFTYAVGNRLLPGRFRSAETVRGILWDFSRKVRGQEFSGWGETFSEFLRLGNELFWPMVVGGLVVGVAAAAVSYPATAWAVRRYRLRRRILLAERARHLFRAPRQRGAGGTQPPSPPEDVDPG